MKVTATLQAPDNAPVDVVWAQDTDAMGVMLCMAQLFSHEYTTTDTRTLAITVEL